MGRERELRRGATPGNIRPSSSSGLFNVAVAAGVVVVLVVAVTEAVVVALAVALAVVVTIAVGQWLVSGLQWSSSARQSLAARQKVLSE